MLEEEVGKELVESRRRSLYPQSPSTHVLESGDARRKSLAHTRNVKTTQDVHVENGVDLGTENVSGLHVMEDVMVRNLKLPFTRNKIIQDD